MKKEELAGKVYFASQILSRYASAEVLVESLYVVSHGCIVHDKPSPLTAEEGLRVLEVVDAVYESSKTGKAVKFPIP
jgi:predicted dehydrogenase